MSTLELPSAEELAEQAAAGFEVNVPVEPIGEPVEKDDEQDEAVILCPGCGTMYDTVHGLHVHMARKHPEIQIDRPARRRTTRTRTVNDTDVPDGAIPDGRRGSGRRSSSKQKRLKAIILEDLNPVIIEAVTTLTKLDKHANIEPALDVVVPQTGKTFRQEIGFSDFEAGAIAKGIVEVGELDAVVKVAEKLGPLLPYLFGVFALGVVGFHTYKVLKIRDMMIMQLAITAQVVGQGSTSNGTKPATQPAPVMSFV